MVVSSCRELDNNRTSLSAASAFAIATAGANEGTPTKEKYRRMSLASTGRSHYWENAFERLLYLKRTKIMKHSFKLYDNVKGLLWLRRVLLMFSALFRDEAIILLYM